MQLDRRKQALLQTIVATYVERAEPVGSHYLALQESLGVRSATIRNELAEMTDLGYLRQPHTSAGRVPSDLGYRYYVDHLMTWERLSPSGARAIRGVQKISAGDLEQLLIQTCRVLSSLTRYTSVAAPPASAEPVIGQVYLVQVAPQRLLAVVVLKNGQVIHRFCEVTRGLTPAEVTRLSNTLDEHLRDLAGSQVAQTSIRVAEQPAHEEILKALVAAIGRGVADEDDDLYVEGASHMLEQPEFREVDRVEPLVRFLEERKTAYEAMQQLIHQQNLTVSIGQENPHQALREVSLVAARYAAGQEMFGWVGVLGPTRMRYEEAVQAVQYAAKTLSETLTRLSSE